ncbi:hypothetical protein DPEC_G00090710, partial [Dallia pectoralis]
MIPIHQSLFNTRRELPDTVHYPGMVEPGARTSPPALLRASLTALLLIVQVNK